MVATAGRALAVTLYCYPYMLLTTTSSLARRGRSLLLAAVGLGAVACCDNPVEPTAEPATPYVLAIPANFPTLPPQPADNPLTEEGVELGRHLFYETALSVDNTISCASCHRQELAFSDGRAHAIGVNGAQHPRSSMSLANMMWEKDLTWDGVAPTLEQQARIPLENPVEMHQPLPVSVQRLQKMPKYPAMFRKAFGTSTITDDLLLKALSQFERTLISGNSRFDKFRRGDRSALTRTELAGAQLFATHPDADRNLRGGNCQDCHAGDLQTNREFSNNGLDLTFTDLGRGGVTKQAFDNGKFRVPSLRNIALTAPYMHDGRFQTLEEVLDHYNEHVVKNSPNLDPLIVNASNNSFNPPGQIRLGLTATEKAQIVAFLRTLTDSTFITDPRFARPQ